MTVSSVVTPQASIDALSIFAPRVDPQSGEAFASELSTSAQALQTGATSRLSTSRAGDADARIQRSASDSADDRADDRADRADAAAASARADRANRADRADRADAAADRADKADAAADRADKADAPTRAKAVRPAKSGSGEAAKADEVDEAEAGPLATVLAPAATAAVAAPATSAVVDGHAAEAPAPSGTVAASTVTAADAVSAADDVSAAIADSASGLRDSGVAESDLAPATAQASSEPGSGVQAPSPSAEALAPSPGTVAGAPASDASTAPGRVTASSQFPAGDVEVDAAPLGSSATAMADGARAGRPQVDATPATPSDAFAQHQASLANPAAQAANAPAARPVHGDAAASGGTAAAQPASSAPGITPQQPAATAPLVADAVRTTGTAAPAPVATQLAAHLTTFRGRADGSYETTLTLHPADLGQVSIRIEVLNGTVAIHATGAHAATVEALRQAMPQLQQELSDAGLNLIGSQVSQQSGQGQQQAADRTPAGTSASPMASGLSSSGRSGEADATAPTQLIGRDGRVDVRV